MAKLRKFEGEHTLIYWFFCPACNDTHPYHVGGANGWEFNGDLERPSFTPSLRVIGRVKRPDGTKGDCHLYVTDGKIRYCEDTAHSMAGQTIDMVDIPPELDWKT